MLHAIVVMYAAILFYVLSMLAIAGAASLNISVTLALFLFLADSLLLLVAILMAVVEIPLSQASIEYEIKRMAVLKHWASSK